MNLQLKPEMQRFVEEQVKSGQYSSAEEVVHAGLAALQQQKEFGDFAPGELDAELAESERSLREEGPIPAEEVFRELREYSRRRQSEGRGKS